MEQIMENIIEIVALLVLLLGGKLIEQADSYLKLKKKEKEAAALEKFVDSLVAAAEQLFKKEDDDGSIRMNYVQNQLIDAGYDLTEAVMALIESKVYNLNIEARKK